MHALTISLFGTDISASWLTDCPTGLLGVVISDSTNRNDSPAPRPSDTSDRSVWPLRETREQAHDLRPQAPHQLGYRSPQLDITLCDFTLATNHIGALLDWLRRDDGTGCRRLLSHCLRLTSHSVCGSDMMPSYGPALQYDLPPRTPMRTVASSSRSLVALSRVFGFARLLVLAARRDGSAAGARWGYCR